MNEPLLPMLAVTGEPFDSEEHIFEVKWDGIRALASTESSGWRLWGRERTDYTPRYPELEFLRRLPAGTILDGELVVLRERRPNLAAVLGRHGLVAPAKVQRASRLHPVTYVVFDLLCYRDRSLCNRPLHERRRILADLLAQQSHPRLAFSDGVMGRGREFFEAVVAQGQEGVMAKHQDSHYRSGRRSTAWRKIKPRRVMPCVIVGFRMGPGREGLRSLLVAAPWQDELQYVAHLATGFSGQVRAQLGELLAKRRRPKPFIACPHQAQWVEPNLYCQVHFLQRTRQGRLRDASFARLIGN